MKPSSWRAIAEAVGIVAIVISLLFVGLELRQAQEVARSETDLSIIENYLSVWQEIGDSPDIWRRGAAGEQLNESEEVTFRTMVNGYNSVVFIDHRRASRLGLDSVADGVIHDFAAFLHQNPGARRVWQAREENLNVYRDALFGGSNPFSYWVQAISADLEKLDNLGLSPPGTVRISP